MGKEKKAGKHRMNKNTMSLLLEQFFRENPGRTFSFKDIFRQLKLNTHPLKMLAIEIMDEMAWADFITRMSDNSYQLRQADSQMQVGTFQRKQNGRNSFIPDGEEKSILVTERNSLFAMNGDRVRVSLMARRRDHAKEAQVVEIIERAKEAFVGRLVVEDDFAVVITRDALANDIIVPKKKLAGARSNDKVVVKVTKWPNAHNHYIIAEVVENLGRCGENEAEMHSILLEYGLPYTFPPEVEEAANKISDKITDEDYAEREDFRDVFTCTIDPKDAKDFDDALSIRSLTPQPPLPSERGSEYSQGSNDKSISFPLSEGRGGQGERPERSLWEVGVHIADVSHYVKEGSVIDKEAQKRATSVYLVDRTIPMLPERLCNNVCSLRPDEEKLAYSVIFTMDDEANVLDYRIVHTVIKSDRRYVYDEVQAILVNENETSYENEKSSVNSENSCKKTTSEKEKFSNSLILDKKNLDPHTEELRTLWHLAKQLRERRFKNGAVRFEGEEMKFELDEKGKPIRCYFKHQFEANFLVEEFMLLANRTVAEHVGRTKTKTKTKTLPYRIHDNPDPQKLEQLSEFIVKFGYKMKTAGTQGEMARALNTLMEQCSGTKQQRLIQTVALRSMMKAKYSVHNIGHFGLAFDYYTHFTSPIRRYPDTMVHRLLTLYANGAPSANADYYEEQCKHSSAMEQLAANAERDSVKYKAVEFMEDKLGQTFDAHISGITSYGLYCEIDENHCEGLVPMKELRDDYYDFDDRNYCLRGWQHGHVYQLGDPIRIKVAATNLEKKQIDFTLA